MKKIILIVLASWMLWQCGSKPKIVQYKLQGKFSENYENIQVVLSTFDKNMRLIPIDTTLIKDSIFEFVIPQQNPQIAIIKMDGFNQRIPVIIGEGDIIIKIDPKRNNPFKNDISGTTSALTHKFFDYENYAINDKEKGIKLLQSYRMAQTDQARDSLKNLYEQWREKAEAYQYDYIENNKDYVGLIIMQSLISGQNADLQKIRNSFDKYPIPVKTSNLGKYINTYILTKGATEIGGKAPNFIGTTPDGKKLSLNQAMGKVTIIDFWASWCRPCRAENPYVVEIYNKYHDQGLNIIGVSLDKNKQSWLNAIKDDGLKWQHVSELKFWQDPIAKMYAVMSIPQTFILDAKGIIRAKNLRREALEQKVKELLNE
jgi:thiol-disulfide isomerase/thioredoxin